MRKLGEFALTNTPLLLHATSITLHVIGIYLLSTVKRRRRNQDLFIANLSACDFAMSTFDLAQNLLQRDRNKAVVVEYLILAQCTLFVVPSLLIMILLTLDRLAEVYYNIKYDLLSEKVKIPVLIIACWVTGVSMAALLFVLNWKLRGSASSVIYKFIFPIVEGIFLLTAAATYTYIYRQYRKSFLSPSVGCISPKPSRPGPTSTENGTGAKLYVVRSLHRGEEASNSDNVQKKRDVHRKAGDLRDRCIQGKGLLRRPHLIRKKNFFVPSLIIVAFILFVIVPDQLNLLIFHVCDCGNEYARNGLLIMYAIGFITDAIIYIFLQKHIRAALLRKLFHRCRDARNSVVPGTTSISSQRHPYTAD